MKDIMDLDFGLGHQEEREKQQTMLKWRNRPFQAGCNRWKNDVEYKQESSSSPYYSSQNYTGEFFTPWLSFIHFCFKWPPHFFNHHQPVFFRGLWPVQSLNSFGRLSQRRQTSLVGTHAKKTRGVYVFLLQIVPQLFTQTAGPQSGSMIVRRKWWENPMNWNHVKSLIKSSINSTN